MDPGLWCEDVVVSARRGALSSQLRDAVRRPSALVLGQLRVLPERGLHGSSEEGRGRFGGSGGRKERLWIVVFVAEVGACGICWSSWCAGQTPGRLFELWRPVDCLASGEHSLA